MSEPKTTMSFMVRPQGMGSKSFGAIRDILAFEQLVMLAYYQNACDATNTMAVEINVASDCALWAGQHEADATKSQGIAGLVGGGLGVLSTGVSMYQFASSAKETQINNRAIDNINDTKDAMNAPGVGAVVGAPGGESFASADNVVDTLKNRSFKPGADSTSFGTKISYAVDPNNGSPVTLRALDEREAAQGLPQAQKNKLNNLLDTKKTQLEHARDESKSKETAAGNSFSIGSLFSQISSGAGNCAASSFQDQKATEQAVQTGAQSTTDAIKSVDQMSTQGAGQALDRQTKALEDLKATIAASARA